MNVFLKLLKAKKRNEIRNGKLWEVTRVFGVDVVEVEQEPFPPEPLVKPEPAPIDNVRNHHLKKEDDVTNLTKNADLI